MSQGREVPCVGIEERLARGVIAGFQVQNVCAEVFYGKHHPVDSKEVAFIAAGRKATMKAIREAAAIVLEPIVNIEVTAPESSIGDLTGDLASKRGHVTGTQPRAAAQASISGQVPLAELEGLSPELVAVLDQARYTTLKDVIDPMASGNPPPVKDDPGNPASRVTPCPVSAAQASKIPDMAGRVKALLAAPEGTSEYDLFCPKS